MNEENQKREYKWNFDEGFRTLHKEIEPARDRIQNYKRKMIQSTSYEGLTETDIKVSTRPVT